MCKYLFFSILYLKDIKSKLRNCRNNRNSKDNISILILIKSTVKYHAELISKTKQ